MKTYEDLKNEYADSRGYDDWEHYLLHNEPIEAVYQIIAEAYVKEVGEQLKRDIADQSKIIAISNGERLGSAHSYENSKYQLEIFPDKESILKTEIRL